MAVITQQISEFIDETQYESLPPEVIHEAKRSLLDALGCAVAGITTDKGKIAISVSKRLGGPQESSILGVGDKLSCANAAMANGELINGLDYDGIPHIHPFAIPPALAIAESMKLSGRDLILSAVIAQELARRFVMALSNMSNKILSEGRTPDVFGNANETIFGATAGVAKLIGLKSDQMAHALGIAAYLCPLPVCRDWEETTPKSMIKYVSAGWICQTSVTSALLAAEGYTGNPTVFDGEYGFARFYGAERWAPEMIVNGLGKDWQFMSMAYKFYPCCRFFHGQLDAFVNILEKNNLYADDIESVTTYALPFVANQAPYDVQTQVDVQFSLPFVLALAANRVKIGAAWQDWETIKDPKINAFMKKITMVVDPWAVETKKKDPKSWPARVEVKAKGKLYKEETLYPKGTNFTEFQATDEELIEKFRNNTSRLLPANNIERAVDCIFGIDTLRNVTELTSLLTL
ncbi:MAG TPA: MmgE/PrpD family protein [Syntrophorhabdaceae bacterium]|nr:MmgE/PrpD family protein [Syntrophorhabdaceae bacterium]